MKKVLYVEDNPTNISLVRAILEARSDVQFLSATHGSIGLELAQQECPDLILLDLHLPDMKGAEYLQRLRTLNLAQRIPVVVISGDAGSQPSNSILAREVEESLTKPFDVNQFEEVVARFLGCARES